MFKKYQNRKGQNTAEYALLISLVVAGIVAMQTYAQRALQARVQSASTLLTDQGTVGQGAAAGSPEWRLDDQTQYEPYYLESEYAIGRDSDTAQILTGGTDRAITHTEDSQRTRDAGGFQRSNYNTQTFGEAF
jgi:Flp pilus assembly pilin Flp